MGFRTFAEYREDRVIKQIAEGILNGTVSLESFAKCLAACKKNDEVDLYNELVSGLANVAGAGLGAMGRGIGSMASAAGRGIAAGAGMAGRAIGAGANAVGNVANQAWQGAQQAGQAIGNTYQQGEQGRKINQAIQSVQQLQANLQQMGLNNQEANQLLQRLVQTLQRGSQRLSQDSSLRFGASGGIWKRPQQATA